MRKEMGRVNAEKHGDQGQTQESAQQWMCHFQQDTCVRAGTTCQVPANILMLNSLTMNLKSVTTEFGEAEIQTKSQHQSRASDAPAFLFTTKGAGSIMPKICQTSVCIITHCN